MTQTQASATLAIDFGTSNSAAGILVNDQPHLIQIERGSKTLPTSLFFDFDEKKILYGAAANSALIQGREGRFMRSLKSVLGTSLMREKRQIMGQSLSFIEIIARFLSEVKSKSEAACFQTFDHALSGRPVHFHSNDAAKDRQALIDLTECYHVAGFKDVQFLAEPEAAAIAYGATNVTNQLGLIVDIGGGTSDFSVFKSRADGQGIEILASHGVRVGGTNFDKSISVDHVMPLLGKGASIRNEFGPGTHTTPNALFQDLATWEKIPFLYAADTKRLVAELLKMAVDRPLLQRLHSILDLELGHDVAFAVERGKIEINKPERDQARINLNVVEPGLGVDLTPDDLANALFEHVETIKTCAAETLAMASCTSDDIRKVIFVGGSSLIHQVETAMANMFPAASLERSDAFTAIVDGLTIAASNAAPR